jgi:8-oxo-dGTP diphosphatase
MIAGMEQSTVSIDVLALRFGNPEPGRLRFAVARRQWKPYSGRIALPGVLLGAGERLNEAAHRAVTSKLGLPDAAVLASGQLTVFDEPSRDPRGPTLSIAMWAVITPEATDDDPELGVQWRSFDAPGHLAFDHDRIVADGRRILASMLWRDPAFTRALLGPVFPTTHALEVTTALTGTRPDPGNLNRTLKSQPGLVRTEERVRMEATGRPAALWYWPTDPAGS